MTSANDLTKIAKRHDDIPQDALFDLPETGHSTDEATKETQKSIRWAKCPHHVPNGDKQFTGLVAVDNKTFAFRDHTKRIGRQTVPCPGSGLVWEGETDAFPR